MTVDDWRKLSERQPDGVYVCLECGEINTYSKYTCARCAARTEEQRDVVIRIDADEGGFFE